KNEVSLNTIPGYIPRPNELPSGCIFAPRCPLAEDECRIARPPLVEVAPGRFSACRRWQEISQLAGSLESTTVSINQPTAEARPLLQATGVKKHFKSESWSLPFLSRGNGAVRAVDGISVAIPKGLTLGLVGESGCGKTTFGRCLVGLIEPTAGQVKLAETTLAPSVARRPRGVLKKIQMVFQNPDASLNPRMAVGNIIARPLQLLGGLSGREASRRVAELLAAVNLPADYAQRLPEELSGGEKQRVAIARAFAADPEVIICDEPISALDVSVQGALINLLTELQRERGTTYLFISHDLAAVRHLSDMVAVVYLGRLWEVGTSAEVFMPPYHPYTEALLSAIPVPDPDVRQKQIRLEGNVPSALNVPSGCRFHTRCPRKIGDICENQEPPWRDVSDSHRICCHIALAELMRIQTPVMEWQRAPESEVGR
ncbi:MAG: ABC transporter ATP-binding protein, partial [Chloroflexota bacterium]